MKKFIMLVFLLPIFIQLTNTILIHANTKLKSREAQLKQFEQASREEFKKQQEFQRQRAKRAAEEREKKRRETKGSTTQQNKTREWIDNISEFIKKIG